VFVFWKDIPHVCMFEQVGDFSYFWTIVREGCPSFVFVSFFGLFRFLLLLLLLLLYLSVQLM